MRTSLRLLQDESEPLISIYEALTHLVIDPDECEDAALIASLVKAATRRAERYTNRSFLEKTYRIGLEDFPRPGVMPSTPQDGVARPARWGSETRNARFPLAIYFYPSPLLSVDSLSYTDPQGVVKTLTAVDDYLIDADYLPSRIAPTLGYWPDTKSDVPSVVTIEYKAGMATTPAGVPDEIRAAVKLMLGHLYEHREDVLSTGVTATTIPQGSRWLLLDYRIRSI